MNRTDIIEKIKTRLGSAVLSIEPALNDDIMILLDKNDFVASVGVLKNDPALAFSTLMNHLGADYGDSMAVIYNLYSPSHRQKLIIKVMLDPDLPEIPSLERAYHGISWFERETYDMFGIRFTGHGNLKRLLLPEDWEGHPLRKNYTYPYSFHGIETDRKDLLEAAAQPGDPHV